jgi:RNA polymerase sigma factor (sigma-70 family)
MAERQVSEKARVEVLTQIERDDFLSKNWREFLTATSIQSLRRSNALVDSTSSPVEQFIRLELVATIRRAIEKLHSRDARIIRLRYGIDGPELTLEAIGNQLGLTRERVRQIQNRAEEHLQTMLKSEWTPGSTDAEDLPKKG